MPIDALKFALSSTRELRRLPAYRAATRRSNRRQLREPRERILRFRENRRQPDLRAAAIGDEMRVLLAQRRVQAEEPTRHGIAAIGGFEVGGVADHAAHLLLERRRPKMRILDLDLVDHVDAEVQMNALVA